MFKILRQFRGTLDRTKNPTWGRRAAIAYAFGTWTLLGAFFIKWKLNHFDAPQKSVIDPNLSEEEKNQLMLQQRQEQKRRSEEISIYVAENVYTPLDFMA